MLKSALSVFLVSCLLGRLDCTELTVKRGEDATLNCYGPTDATIVLLRWEKRGGPSDSYVFYVRDRRPNENYQLPSFKGRVKLKDPQMKDGDLSVIIKHVSMNDTGIYECHAGYNKQRPQLMSSINLTVEESGPTGGQSGDRGKEDGGKSGPVGLIVGLSVLAVLVVVVVVVVGFLIYKKCKKQTNPNYQRPADQNI